MDSLILVHPSHLKIFYDSRILVKTLFVSTVAVYRSSGMGVEVECFRDTIRGGFGGFQTVFPGMCRHRATQPDRGRRR